MKALSLIQPWASLLFPFAGRQPMKLHETRSWRTPLRGIIAIHCSASKKREDEESYGEILIRCGLTTPKLFDDSIPPAFRDLPRGCIIGTVEIVDCLSTNGPPGSIQLTPEDAVMGNYSQHRWAWRFQNPRLLREPLPCRGALQLWDVPLDIEKAIDGQSKPVCFK